MGSIKVSDREISGKSIHIIQLSLWFGLEQRIRFALSQDLIPIVLGTWRGITPAQIYKQSRKKRGKEEEGKLRRRLLPEKRELQPVSRLLTHSHVCYSAHRVDPQEVYMQKWVCTLALSQFWHLNCPETSMQESCSVNTQLRGHWSIKWCMGLSACSFCCYSVLIHTCVCARKITLLWWKISVCCHSALVFHER